MPRRFVPNPATAADNAFQCRRPRSASPTTRRRPRRWPRWTPSPQALRDAGVRVHVFEDEDHTRPDSVFPNNWLSTHAGGNVAVYPMYASNRRHERRADVLEMLKSHVPGPDDRRLLRPRARRHLPRGHRRDGPRPRVAGRLHRAQPPRRHPRAGAVLHRLRLRADGLRRGRLRGRAGLPHQRDRLHRHRRRADRAGDDPRRAASRRRSASGSRSTAARSSS